MWPTFLNLWRTLSSKAPRQDRPRWRAARCRPSIELLEARAVPAALGYSTYLGSAVQAVAVGPGDTTGDVYAASGGSVLKLNNGGSGLVYGTNVGGTIYGLAVDAAGDAYVIGRGVGVPTTPNAIASSGNIFVAELNPTGGLVYATYLPSAVGNLVATRGDCGAIAVDGSGNIYVTGGAQAGFPVTAGAFQTTYLGQSGYSNAFFAKINPALSGSTSLVYATYLGGTGFDAGYGIALDASGNAYLTGYTYSSDFPTTFGAYQTARAGVEDAFVAKFNPALSGSASLVYCTLLGGSVRADGFQNGATGYVSDSTAAFDFQIDGAIAVDSAGNAYVTSSTTATDFPTTPGAFQTQSNLQFSGSFGFPPSDAFVTKLNPTGTTLVYSTYLGGGTDTRSGGAGIALDASGDAYLTGWTNSTVFPTTDPLQATNAGGWDAFATVLNPSGSGLLSSSYLGGSSNDWGYGVALDPGGNVYVAGVTQSSNFPRTPGAYQTGGSGFVTKITMGSPAFTVTGFPSPTTAGEAGTFTVTAVDPNGNPLTGYNGTIHFTSSDHQAVLPPNYTFTAADQGVHTFSATLKTAGSQAIYAQDTTTLTLDGGQLPIQVNPVAATHFVFSGPSTVTAGTAFRITVTALDAFNNVATGYTGTVHFAATNGAMANYTFTDGDQGQHAFTITLYRAGALGITGTDTVSDITGMTSFTIVAAAPDHLSFSEPATVTAGVPFQITVTMQDTYNNTVTGYTGTVHFTASNGASADYTFTADDQGTHAFTVALRQAGMLGITGTDTANPGLTGGTSFTVVLAAADHLVFLQPPSDTPAGQAIRSVVVALVDQFGNVETNDNSDTVSLSLSTNPGGGTLSGTLTLTVSGGLATFSGLSIDQPGSGYTLHATVGGGLPDIDSDPFTIT
jgi:hypothetical protein